MSAFRTIAEIIVLTGYFYVGIQWAKYAVKKQIEKHGQVNLEATFGLNFILWPLCILIAWLRGHFKSE